MAIFNRRLARGGLVLALLGLASAAYAADPGKPAPQGYGRVGVILAGGIPTEPEAPALSNAVEARLAAMEKLLADQAARIHELEARLAGQTGPGILPNAVGELTAAQPPTESPLDKAVREALEQAGKAGESPLDKAVREAGGGFEPPVIAGPARGGPTLRLIDTSVNLLTAGGASTKRDEPLQFLQGGGHDPRKRGFTLQNLELSLSGAIDPYFRGETHLIFFIEPLSGETIVELEEAFFETLSLPCGYEIRGGQFFTEFGRINANHPHAWTWQDQPIINTRMFGPDGLRAPGIRVSKLLNTPYYSKVFLGMQNANGETTASFLASEEFFEERPIGGRPFTPREVRTMEDILYTFRSEVSGTCHFDEVTWLAGVSALYGPNATGDNGRTLIAGVDLKVKWVPENNERGWPFVLFEAEAMFRNYRADGFAFDPGEEIEVDDGQGNLILINSPDDDIILPDRTLHDWGFYAQVLCGFKYQWAAGLRYEFASGEGDSVFAFDGRQNDPFRDDRHRVSPMLVWYPTEFARIRLQYNFDHAEHLTGDAAHSVWFGFEGTYGVHPPHKF